VIIADLVARVPVNLGHRKLVAKETFTRMQFRSEDDFKAFRTLLRWSSFEFSVVDQPPADQAPADQAPPAKRSKG
jgi:hypothetical protein